MQFKSDGTLKIMQITDMQEIPAISPDTLALLDAAVEAEHPDLVIYTGDQIKGYGVTYKSKTKKELEAAVAKTITALLEPVTRRHIPFAVTFGNHDRQVGISNADQFNDIYKSLPGCIGEQAEGIPGGGTYAVPLTASDGSGRTLMNLYLFDTGTDARAAGMRPLIRPLSTGIADPGRTEDRNRPLCALFGIPAHSHAGVLPCAATGEKKRERRHPSLPHP